MITFDDLKIGDCFTFAGADIKVIYRLVDKSVYRKVSDRYYVYDNDKTGVWKYWTPGTTKVRPQEKV